MYDIDLSSVQGVWSSYWSVCSGALQLDPDAYIAVVNEDGGTLLAWLIVLVAGVSFMIGQSIVLLANHVSRRRFITSLVTGALVLVLEIGLWAVSAWLVGALLIDGRPRLLDALTLVWLSHAPLLFGFLVLLPYLGAVIEKALQIWILLALVVAVHAVYQSGFWESIACAAIGWFAVQFIFRFGGLAWLRATRKSHISLPPSTPLHPS
ncbi:MAG: hypothetical protein AB7R89_19965 [Dehalococcoidia bacterium]